MHAVYKTVNKAYSVKLYIASACIETIPSLLMILILDYYYIIYIGLYNGMITQR